MEAQYYSNNYTNKIYIYTYFKSLKVSFHDMLSVFGFFVFLVIINQILSGIMLSFSVVTDCMLVWVNREEEDLEDLYIDDFFWLHERGVDVLFLTVYIHLFRKLYLGVCDLEQQDAWKSGVATYLILQVVVFTGISLSCTHLSEITLTIAANVLHTFFFFKTRIYWLIFTDKQLNTDTLIRLTYLHYVLAFFVVYLGLVHGIDMHYDWKNEYLFDGIRQELDWWDEVFLSEISKFFDLYFIIFFCFYIFYSEPEALTYEIFTWGDVGFVVDIRFYGVAPHWYFRPFMAWLVVCPDHYLGIFGLVYFFIIIYFQVDIFGSGNLIFTKRLKFSIINLLKFNLFKIQTFQWKKIQPELDLYWFITYVIFILSIMCTLSFLPYGRFYNRLGGNTGMLWSFMYIFAYLSFPILRFNWVISSKSINILN